jgi:hypothetical protein
MDKTIKLLEEFLKEYTMEGTCGFWVQPDEDGGIPSVYIIVDVEWIKTKRELPGLVTRKMRQGLKKDIKNWTGVDVSYVGSTAKTCKKTKDINESVSTYLRRRFSFDAMKENIDSIVDYELNPCEFSDVGDFIAEACDMLSYNCLEEIQVSPKDKDGFYEALVDLFGEYLVSIYEKRCIKGYKNESIINWELWHKVNGKKNTIIVTESQYNRLFEQKKSKVEMFQDLINDKLEYIRGFCDKDLESENYSGDVGFEACSEVEMIDSIKVDEVNMMTGARTDMSGNMYDSTPSIYVKLMINYSNIRDRYDFDEIIYDLRHILKKSTGGLPIVFDYRTNNISKIKE